MCVCGSSRRGKGKPTIAILHAQFFSCCSLHKAKLFKTRSRTEISTSTKRANKGFRDLEIFRDTRILKKVHTVKLAFRIFGFKMQPRATSCVYLPVHN